MFALEHFSNCFIPCSTLFHSGIQGVISTEIRSQNTYKKEFALGVMRDIVYAIHLKEEQSL